MITKMVGLIIIGVLIFGALIIADTQEAKAEGKDSSFEGQLVCLACTLKDTEGARAECRNYGHEHALQTADGSFISFIENKYSVDLFKGEKFHGKEVWVQGVYYANANMLDVESYKIDDVTISWCNAHKVMDRCNSDK